MAPALRLVATIDADTSGFSAGARTVVQDNGAMAASARAADASFRAAAASASRLSAASIDQRIGVRSDFGAAQRAADIAAYGKSLDDLRARFNPLFAAEQAHQAQLEAIGQAQRVGAISATEAAEAVGLQQAMYSRQVSAINASRNALNQNSAAAKLSGMQVQQLSFQLNDAATMALSGASAFQILATQGGQVVQVFQMGQGGIKGAISGVGASLMALPGPAKVAGIALLSIGAAAVVFSALRKEAETVDETLQRHKDTVARLKEAYGDGTRSIREFAAEGRNVVDALARVDRLALGDQLQAEAEKAKIAFGDLVRGAAGGGFALDKSFLPFQAPLEKFFATIEAGQPDVRALRSELADIANANPADEALQKLYEKAINATKGAEKLQAALLGIADAGSLMAAELGKAVKQLDGIAAVQPTDLEAATKAYREGLSAAKTPGERAALEASFLAAQDRIAGAAMPTPRAKPNLADYDPDAPFTAAHRAAQDRIQSLLIETETLGRATGAVEAFRLQQELLADLQRDVGVVTDEQRKRIEALAEGYGELVLAQKRASVARDLAFEASQFGRSPIEQQVATTLRDIYGDDYLAHMDSFQAKQIRNNATLKALYDTATSARDAMEKLQLQLGLVGAPVAEQNRAFALLEANQQIRRQGLDGSYVADIMRRNALATADATTELERQQAAWQSWRDQAGGSIDAVVGDIATGKAGLDTLSSAAESASKWFAQLAIANPLKNALLGENLPTASDVWDRITGKKVGSEGLASALASSVATMNVSAATVVINGGLGSLAGGLGGAANDNLGARAAGIGSDFAASAAANDNFSIEAAAKAIRTIESGSAGGNYLARGPVLASGDRAYGAYQVMGENVPSWTERWAGRAMSPAEFLANPAAQDAVFKGQFGSYVGKYGPTGAAQAWLGGPGSVGNLDAADVNGTTVGGYGGRFGALYQQFAGAGTAVDGLSKSATATAGSVGQLGSGLNDLTNSVSNAAAKIGQGLVGADGTFGGVARSVYASLGAPAAGGVYDVGGFTGYGPKHKVAGIVHAGEVVFSQEDVARSGGVAAVEAIRRRGMAGYASGGTVLPLRTSSLSGSAWGTAAGGAPAASAGGGIRDVRIINTGTPIGRSRSSERPNADGTRDLIIQVGEAMASEASRDGSPLDQAINRQRLVGR